MREVPFREKIFGGSFISAIDRRSIIENSANFAGRKFRFTRCHRCTPCTTIRRQINLPTRKFTDERHAITSDINQNYRLPAIPYITDDVNGDRNFARRILLSFRRGSRNASCTPNPHRFLSHHSRNKRSAHTRHS